VFSVDTEIVINSVTATGGIAGAGILIDGSAGGTTTITSFNGNTVVDAGAIGIDISDVTFDADTSNMVIDTVAGGDLNVGVLANRVNGDGVLLNNVLGDIAFEAVNIFNNAGTGLFLRDAAGGTFSLSNTGGTIDTTNGTAIDIDSVRTDLTFDTVSSTNARGQGESFILAGGMCCGQCANHKLADCEGV